MAELLWYNEPAIEDSLEENSKLLEKLIFERTSPNPVEK